MDLIIIFNNVYFQQKIDNFFDHTDPLKVTLHIFQEGLGSNKTEQSN